jgi:hypothetical protein
MASKKHRKTHHGDSAQPHENPPMPESEGHPEEQSEIPADELQSRYRSLDQANSQASAFRGQAGVSRRKNNPSNPHVAKKETQVVNG